MPITTQDGIFGVFLCTFPMNFPYAQGSPGWSQGGEFCLTLSQKTFPGRVRVKFAQNEGHEKAMKNAQTLFFHADEGHEKVTSKNVTSNEKSSDSPYLDSPYPLKGLIKGVNFHPLNFFGGGAPPKRCKTSGFRHSTPLIKGVNLTPLIKGVWVVRVLFESKLLPAVL